MNQGRGRVRPVVYLFLLMIVVAVGYGGYSLLSALRPSSPVEAPAAFEPFKAPASPPTTVPLLPFVQPEESAPAATENYTTFQQLSNCPEMPPYTVGFDTFAPYDTLIIMKQFGIDCTNGFNLVLVPFYIDENHEFDEASRTANMASGSWDGLLTTWDKLATSPEIGQLTFYSDETDGADMLVCKPHITRLNDLRGASVAYVEDSISETFLAYVANYQKIGRDEFDLHPFGDVPPAVEAFNNGEVDCFSGWDVPEALAAAEEYGTLVDSHSLRISVDVGITSYNAINNRPEVVQAFHNAWLQTTAKIFDFPDDTEASLIAWGQQNILYSTADTESYNLGDGWLGIVEPGDYTGWMEVIAMATPQDQIFAMNNPDKVNSRLQDNSRVLRAWGKDVFWSDNPADYGSMVNPTFILAAAERPESKARSFPINATFQLIAAIDLPQLTEEEVASATELATLPVSQITFMPNSTQLTDEAVKILTNEVAPLMLAGNYYLRLGGSSSNVGGRYSLELIEEYSLKRVNSVITELTRLGIDPDRLIPYWVPPQYPDSQEPTDHAKDRYVEFRLLDTGW